MLTVSNFQLQVNVNKHSGVSGKNLIYDIHNPDGSVDRVRRVWHVYGRAPEYRSGLKNTAVIEPAPVRMHSVLKNYALAFEKNVGNKKFPNANKHLCGALLSKTRIVPAPAKKVAAPPAKPSVPQLSPQQVVATIQGLDAQIKKLTADIVEINKQLASAKTDKIRLNAELIKTQEMLAKSQKDNAIIKAALQILLNK